MLAGLQDHSALIVVAGELMVTGVRF